MNFGRFDMVILTTMSLSIILMSFAFPALGMAGASNETAESDVPEFNMSASNFDLVGDFPNDPQTPSQFEITFLKNDTFGDTNERFLEGDDTNGFSVAVHNNTTSGESVFSFIEYVSGSPVYVNVTMDGEGDTTNLESSSYRILVEVIEYENAGTENFTFTADVDVPKRPEDTTFLGGVPIIGTLFGAGEAVANILGYIAAIAYWFFGTFWETVIAVVVMLFNIMTFGVELLVWMTNTYLDVVAEAGSFASAILMVPAILLFAEFAKIGMIGVKLLPTT